MIKGITYPLALLKALKLEKNGEYKNAIDVLLKYSNFVEDRKDKYPDYYIVLAELYSRLGKYGDSEKLFSNSIKILNNTNEFNSDEKAYLKKYIYLWLKHIAEVHNNSLAIKKYKTNISELFYSEEKIRSSIKINFGMNIFL